MVVHQVAVGVEHTAADMRRARRCAGLLDDLVPTVMFASATRFVGIEPVTSSGATSLSTFLCCGVP